MRCATLLVQGDDRRAAVQRIGAAIQVASALDALQGDRDRVVSVSFG